MKKTSLFVFVLFLAVAMQGKRENPWTLLPSPGDPIELRELLSPPLPGPKSNVIPIQAWHDHKLGMIYLEINDLLGPVVVIVEDALDHVILQQTVDGNQPLVTIPLSGLQPGCYKLTIQSSTHLLVGIFEAE
ncbi:MAG: DUF3244 domain-containing protein [Bacteroidetes bacterium]|nr:DUF3244 domain-containing protein [Bacteroidota bacterium]